MTERELHALAKSYIDDVLAIHRASGELDEVSDQEYLNAVEAVESVLREFADVSKKRAVAA